MTSSFISNAEQQARIDLAACYRLVDLYGMSDMILNHITVRVPGDDDHCLQPDQGGAGPGRTRALGGRPG